MPIFEKSLTYRTIFKWSKIEWQVQMKNDLKEFKHKSLTFPALQKFEGFHCKLS